MRNVTQDRQLLCVGRFQEIPVTRSWMFLEPTQISDRLRLPLSPFSSTPICSLSSSFADDPSLLKGRVNGRVNGIKKNFTVAL